MKLLSILVVLAAPLLAFAQDESEPLPGAGTAAQSVVSVPSDVAQESARRRLERPGYPLPPGKTEIGGFFGGNVFTGTIQPNPSLGGELVLGLPHGFGVFGQTAWNRVFGLELPDGQVGVALYDLGGGLQWTPFHWGRFGPYLRGGVSWVRVSGGGRIGGEEFGHSTDRLAANLGFGARIYMNERYGVLFDFGAVQGPGYTVLGRFSAGLFYHFK